jgi:hypothetical protein
MFITVKVRNASPDTVIASSRLHRRRGQWLRVIQHCPSSFTGVGSKYDLTSFTLKGELQPS